MNRINDFLETKHNEELDSDLLNEDKVAEGDINTSFDGKSTIFI